MAARADFMSALPRPYNQPSDTVASKGGKVQSVKGPAGTTSVWPAKTRVGPGMPLSLRAQKFFDIGKGHGGDIKTHSGQALNHEGLTACILG